MKKREGAGEGFLRERAKGVVFSLVGRGSKMPRGSPGSWDIAWIVSRFVEVHGVHEMRGVRESGR